MRVKHNWNDIVTEATGYQGLHKIVAELNEFRRQWSEEHEMPPLPKKHFVEGRKGRTSGHKPSHLPPSDWKRQK